VKKLIEGFDVQPAWITFEITESVAASNHEMLQDVMESLKSNGHRFAMDDYGTGYSNMHSFITLDFDVVKVDKSVLWDAEKNQTGMAILQNSVNMLKSVDSTVLVEGVETAKQVEMLRMLGVNYFQGFYFARPMPVEDLVAQLGANGPDDAANASGPSGPNGASA
jgi:EAL domain-containing protein (putative c-di-GMP-specific phosphodiesterase class I)